MMSKQLLSKPQNCSTEPAVMEAMSWKIVSIRMQRYHRHRQKCQTQASRNSTIRIHHLKRRHHRRTTGSINLPFYFLFFFYYYCFHIVRVLTQWFSYFTCFVYSGLASNAELRRRKRQKRNADIEAKIKDIKRKQKETEAAAEAAPKKRRCLMIFSGVVVCVICCAYVYSKLG